MRAAIKKGFIDWAEVTNSDIICLQEVKAELNQLPVEEIEELGFEFHLHTAEKKGYSGVGILTKLTPLNVVKGCGIPAIDREGRIIRVDYEHFSIMSVYLPSGTTPIRQEFKLEFLKEFRDYITDLVETFPRLILCGDFNICHNEIDIHNPIRHKNTPGFTPVERNWMTDFLNDGFVDSFRNFNQEADQYTWWSYRANSRNKNLGWRIDYQLVSQPLLKNLSSSGILKKAEHSDHCPVQITLDL